MPNWLKIELLALAATPTFAFMALFNIFWGPPDLLCVAGSGSVLTGMTVMYVLMGVFHATPWVKLIQARTKLIGA
jgi:hypothetical protein